MKTLARLGTQNIRQLLWEFSVPAVVSTVANALYTVVNRLFIGQGCGRDAIAGVALAFAVVGLPFVTIAYFQSVGRPALAIALSVLRQLVLLLPLIVLLPRVGGVTGIWAASPVSDAAAAALTCFVAAAELRRLKRLAPPATHASPSA